MITTINFETCNNIDCGRKLTGFELSKQSRFCTECKRRKRAIRYKCTNCDNLIVKNDSRGRAKRLCSICYQNYRKQSRRLRDPKPERKCLYCEKDITNMSRKAKCCSNVCWWRNERGVKLVKNCAECGILIDRIKYRKALKFCSRKCQLINYHKREIQKLILV